MAGGPASRHGGQAVLQPLGLPGRVKRPATAGQAVCAAPALPGCARAGRWVHCACMPPMPCCGVRVLLHQGLGAVATDVVASWPAEQALSKHRAALDRLKALQLLLPGAGSAGSRVTAYALHPMFQDSLRAAVTQGYAVCDVAAFQLWGQVRSMRAAAGQAQVRRRCPQRWQRWRPAARRSASMHSSSGRH